MFHCNKDKDMVTEFLTVLIAFTLRPSSTKTRIKNRSPLSIVSLPCTPRPSSTTTRIKISSHLLIL